MEKNAYAQLNSVSNFRESRFHLMSYGGKKIKVLAVFFIASVTNRLRKYNKNEEKRETVHEV